MTERDGHTGLHVVIGALVHALDSAIRAAWADNRLFEEPLPGEVAEAFCDLEFAVEMLARAIGLTTLGDGDRECGQRTEA